jgi:hypothetical protein
MKIMIIIISFLLAIISLTMATRLLSNQFNSQVELSPPTQWNTYTSTKYHFTINYPADWISLEVPSAGYPGILDQVMLTGSVFPPPQTSARADIHLLISEVDPTGNWHPGFFDDYKLEEIPLGNVTAIKISGINKESLHEELVVITKIGNYFLQASPNFSSDSIKYFDQVISSLQINTQGTHVILLSATDSAQTSQIITVTNDGIDFTYDTSLAERVTSQTIPLYTDLSGFTFNDIPEHIRFDFVNPYTNQEPFSNTPQHLMPWLSHQNLGYFDFSPQIFIFPTRDFADISRPTGERIETLKGLLNAEPLPSDNELPVLPMFNSTQDLRAQVRHVDFQGGSGIRFITRYTQEATPVTNPAVFYTFQGLTEDGERYVSAFFAGLCLFPAG